MLATILFKPSLALHECMGCRSPQAAREEKWVAECQVDALKRDLEHATSQVAELQEAEDDRSQADIEHERSTDGEWGIRRAYATNLRLVAPVDVRHEEI